MTVNLDNLHPRQAEILVTIPEEYRSIVLSRAYLLQNLGGGNLSGALWNARLEYNRLGAVGLEHLSRADNRSAMQACCDDCRSRVK